MHWNRLKKPWTKEQCRRRYVEGGDDIGIRGLADTSGQPKGTVERWARQELWVDQRRRYKDALTTTVQQKTLEKTSDKLSDELSEIAIANYDAHKFVRDYLLEIFRIKVEHLDRIESLSSAPTEEQLAEIKLLEDKLDKIKKFHNPHELNQLSLGLGRSTQEIAASVGLPYFVNINSAYKKLETEGYVVINPGEEQESNDEEQKP